MRPLHPALLLAATSIGCSVPTVDDHFDCAALIWAAGRLSDNGTHPAPAAFQREVLGASMTHLAAWAVPAAIREQDAMARVKARRDELIGSTPPEELLRRATACVDRI